MKKLLLASTALAFSAGFAAADIALSGGAQMGVDYNDSASDELALFYQVDFGMSGSGETDGGLAFGASIDLDAAVVRGTGNQNSPAPGEDFDPEIFISGAFGTLSVGNVDPATDSMGISDVGLDGLEVDDVAETYKNAAGSANVVYEYGFDAVTFIASFHTVQEDYAVHVNYDAGSFDVGVGYATDEQTDGATVTVDGGVDLGGFDVAFIYTDWDGGNVNSGGTGYGVSASTDLGGVTVTVALSGQDDNSTPGESAINEGYGIGFEYGLGGGASLKGGVSSVNDVTRASFGVDMSF